MSLAGSKPKKNRTALKPAYEDRAQPKHVSVIVVTAVAAGVCFLPVVSYFLKRGRRGRTTSSNDGSTPSVHLPSPQRRQLAQPSSLAELRAIRAKAAESRCSGDSPENLSRKLNLTPLGQAIEVARKVDVVEKKALTALKRVKSDDSSPPDAKEIAMLLEELTQVQLELDSVKGDDSSRPLKKSQTQRIQRLVQRLDSFPARDPKKSPTEGDVTEVTETSNGES